MANQSANATIKGYFYQFDHSILQLLSAADKNASVLIEGIEDVDLTDSGDAVLIQCKYYEGTEYNHSVIKDAVIKMLRHFHAGTCAPTQTLKYRLYGHYKSGHAKLSHAIDINFLKTNFLTYSSKKKKHAVHDELPVDDTQLAIFLKLLEINIQAKTYDEQQKEVMKLLISGISGCSREDAEAFHYPLAMYTIQKLAVQRDEANRKITKSEFLKAINTKEIVFSAWLRRKFGDDYYARSVKRRHFNFGSTKIPKASRIFILDTLNEFDTAQITAVLEKIGNKFSHVEHTRTPADDRFCPYVLLSSASPEEVIDVKTALHNSGVKIEDGHPFNGARFYADELAIAPTKDNLVKLKFIPSPLEIQTVIPALGGTSVAVFEFYKETPAAGIQIPTTVPHHKFKIQTIHFVIEAI